MGASRANFVGDFAFVASPMRSEKSSCESGPVIPQPRPSLTPRVGANAPMMRTKPKPVLNARVRELRGGCTMSDLHFIQRAGTFGFLAYFFFSFSPLLFSGNAESLAGLFPQAPVTSTR